MNTTVQRPDTVKSTAPRFGTITLSPALDCTVQLSRPLIPGDVHAIRSEVCMPGGKGINVARLLSARGHVVVAGGLLGRDVFECYCAQLEPSIKTAFVAVDAETRRNVMLLDGRHEYKLNRPAFPFLAYSWDAVWDTVRRVAEQVDVILLCGSLPVRFPPDLYARIIRELRRLGLTVGLDTSGMALSAGIEGQPHIIKPNHCECEQLMGRGCETPSAWRRALFDLADRFPMVVLSDGPRGAGFAEGSRKLFASSPKVTRMDTTAAGDYLLAQFCSDYFVYGLTRETAARAVAAGAAAIECVGARCPDIARIDALAPMARVRALRDTRRSETEHAS